MAIATSSD